MSIGQRISKLRKDLGYSQEYVAERLDVSRQAVSKWETDASAPDTYNLIALAELFDVSVEYIAIGKQSEPAQPTFPKHASITVRQIVGVVLLGVGLLSLIFGVLLSELLIVLSLYLIALGALAITIRKNRGFISMWVLLGITCILLMLTARFSIFGIFFPASYAGGISIWLIISYLFWIWLIVAVVVLVSRIIKKHQKHH
jgi:transcriptional regulator with XRE-family HTH domain